MHVFKLVEFDAGSTMKLTRYTDYAMRVMIHAASKEGELSSIREISETFRISQNHLMKVVQDLSNAGFVETVRGRHGGIRLAKLPENINLGSLLRHTETLSDLVDCSGCVIAPACSFPSIMNEATAAFIGVFEKYTLADLLGKKQALRLLFANSIASGVGELTRHGDITGPA